MMIKQQLQFIIMAIKLTQVDISFRTYV